MADKKEIGNRLKTFRKAIGKTQQEIGKEAGFSPSYIARIEMGQVYPNLELLEYLTTQFKLDFKWILTGEGEKPQGQNGQPQEEVNIFDIYPNLPEDPRILEMIGDLKKSNIYYPLMNYYVELRSKPAKLCPKKRISTDDA